MDTQAARYAGRLWLQTDAAFGLRDVPLVLPMPVAPPVAGNAAGKLQNPAPAAHGMARPVTSVLRAPKMDGGSPPEFHRPVAAPPDRPVAQRQGVGIPRSVKLPPIPEGHLDALEPIRDAEKPRLLAELQEETGAALNPYISEIATQVVFGSGDPAAKLMFVGEGPGVEEDKTGIPFVGRSGQLLDKMIVAMGLSRQTVYIGNVVKLRAAEADPASGRLRDRPPTPAEVALNIPFLHKQIEIIRPQVIVTLGAPALKYLTGTVEGISLLRGTWMTYRGVPLMPTYHPSFLLRVYTPENRAKVWGDLQQVMAKLGLKPTSQK